MSVRLILGERVWPARLDVDGIDELESETKVGLWLIQQKLVAAQCSLAEVRQVVRLGLIGAGASEKDALEVVITHCVAGKLEARRHDAILIVDAAMDDMAAGDEDLHDYEVAGGKSPAPQPTGSGASGISPTGD